MIQLHFIPRSAAAFLCVVMAVTCSLRGQTTVVVPCAADNTLYESVNGTLSNGAGDGLFAGVTGNDLIRRTLVRFDVAAFVPAGAVILSARFEINVTMASGGLPLDVTAHRVLQDWGEGTSVASGNGGGGTGATAGDATWLHAFYPNTLWATAGGDFAVAPSFIMPTPAFGVASSPIGPGSVVDAQFWLDQPTSNFGWVVRADETQSFTARRMESRESTGIKPSLTIQYLLPGEVGTWGTGCPVGAGTFQFAWSGQPIGSTTIQLVQSNGPAFAIGANFFALALDPIGTQLLPGCNLYLPIAGELIPGSIFVLDAAGGASSPFAVPAGYPGQLVVSQSVALQSNALGFVLSNAGLADLQ